LRRRIPGRKGHDSGANRYNVPPPAADRLGATQAEAADAVQDAFASALRAADQVRDQHAWPAWLRTVAFRCYLRSLALRGGRADLPFARVPARRPPGGPGPRSEAVALVCEHLEDFVLALGCLLLEAAFPDLIGSQMQRAADVLLALRGEVEAWTASPASVASALAEVRDALGQADLVLRVELGTPLDEAFGAGPLAGPGVGQEPRLEAAFIYQWCCVCFLFMLESVERHRASVASRRGQASASGSTRGRWV
jgi:Sigma-70 region 2